MHKTSGGHAFIFVSFETTVDNLITEYLDDLELHNDMKIG